MRRLNHSKHAKGGSPIIAAALNQLHRHRLIDGELHSPFGCREIFQLILKRINYGSGEKAAMVVNARVPVRTKMELAIFVLAYSPSLSVLSPDPEILKIAP